MDLEAVFAETDLLVVPSICPETFGYVALEALSCGVPVLLSGNVGARDILAQGAGIVIEDITAVKLYDTLRGITRRQLREMERVILKRQEIPMMDRVAVRIEEKCYGWDRRGG